ncbi:MAG: hypothetical protein ACPGUV_02675 [Polyangiales bacterium]
MHCGKRLAAPEARFCCGGCRGAYEAMQGQALERFYALGGHGQAPVQTGGRAVDGLWLEAMAEQLAQSEGLQHLSLSVQGMHCSGCGALSTHRRPRAAAGAGQHGPNRA